MNASEDVLDSLAGFDDVPPRTQQDLVAAVKTVYALTHTSRLPAIQKLASQAVQELAADDTAQRAAAVQKLRQFWAEEFNTNSPAGKRWASLVQTAHVETPWLVGAVATSYDDAVNKLQSGLEELVCPC